MGFTQTISPFDKTSNKIFVKYGIEKTAKAEIAVINNPALIKVYILRKYNLNPSL